MIATTVEGETWSEAFRDIWMVESYSLFGVVLPMNFLRFNSDTYIGEIGHKVPDGDAPLQTADGEAIRLFTVSYMYFGVMDDDKH